MIAKHWYLLMGLVVAGIWLSEIERGKSFEDRAEKKSLYEVPKQSEPAENVETDSKWNSEESFVEDQDESVEESFVRRSSEIERQMESGELVGNAYVTESLILEAEIGAYELSKHPYQALTAAEQEIVKECLNFDGGEGDSVLSTFVSKLDDRSSPAMYFIAGGFYYEMGDIENAAGFYLTALDREAEMDRMTRYRVNSNLGIVLARADKFEQAAVYLQKAIWMSEEPEPRLHGFKGMAEFNLGNFAASEYHYRKAVELAPNSSNWTIGYSEALLKVGKFDEALDFLKSIREGF